MVLQLAHKSTFRVCGVVEAGGDEGVGGARMCVCCWSKMRDGLNMQ